MDQKNDLQVLEERIEYYRKKLHAAYQMTNSFVDLEVYCLSIKLDIMIAEYQRRVPLCNGKLKKYKKRAHPLKNGVAKL